MTDDKKTRHKTIIIVLSALIVLTLLFSACAEKETKSSKNSKETAGQESKEKKKTSKKKSTKKESSKAKEEVILKETQKPEKTPELTAASEPEETSEPTAAPEATKMPEPVMTPPETPPPDITEPPAAPEPVVQTPVPAEKVPTGDGRIEFKPVRSDGINLRTEPTHYSDLAAELPAGVSLFWYGEIGTGMGSDNVEHMWYKVDTETGITGWARADLLQEVSLYKGSNSGGGDYFYSASGDAVNLRSEPRYDSELIATVSGDTRLFLVESHGYGYGSDGQMHAWFLMRTEEGTEGWVRTDLITKR